MKDFGGMVSFLDLVRGGRRPPVAETQVFTLAESLGGVETLIEQPAQMTHASTADAPFAVPELSSGFCRDPSSDDLVADLEQAFAAVRTRV